MKKTHWFPAHVKPVRKGVYEWKRMDWLKGGWFRRWDGESWMIGSNNIHEAARSEPRLFEPWKDEKWRGLASKDGK